MMHHLHLKMIDSKNNEENVHTDVSICVNFVEFGRICSQYFLSEIFHRRKKSKFFAEIFRAEIDCDEIIGVETFFS